MKNAKWKKAQRALNKTIREMRKTLQTDPFILKGGDFEIRQIDAFWERFADGSGGALSVALQIAERRTGRTDCRVFHDVNYGYFAWKFFEWVNDFVCEFV